MSRIVDGLLGVPPGLAYLLIGLLVFGEAAVFLGFVLPGETAVILGGVMASTGRLSLPVLLVVVVLAAIGGDSVGYEVGKHFGPRVLELGPMRRHAGRLDGARRFLREKGGWAVVLGRFTAFLRAVMPGMAGLSGMPYRRFLPYNALGAVIWGSGVAVLGYLAGASYKTVEKTFGRGTAAFTAVVVLVGVLLWVRSRKKAERAAEATPQEQTTNDG